MNTAPKFETFPAGVDTAAMYLHRDNMREIIGKVFKAGNSKALRLPSGFATKAKSYRLTATITGFVATDPEAEARRLRAFQALRGSCPDFPDHRT